MHASPSLLLLLAATACTGRAPDTSDSGGTTDSGDTTDTSDTSDTADTGDTGDTAEPVMPRIAWFADVGPVDLTPDGSIALVQSMTTFEGELLFIDTALDTLTSQTTLGDAGKNMATGVSADRRISALHGIPVEAGLWGEADGWQDIASPFDSGCDSDNGGAFDVSDDGTVAVGLMWDGCAPAAFRWTAAGGTLILDTLGEAYEGSPSPPTNRASFVSGDGLVTGGFAAYGALDRSPARWTADGAGELLAPDDHDQTGEVLSIDYDGSTLGVLRGNDGYVWSEAGGFVSLGRLDTAMPTDPVYPNALSRDGSAAFGGVGSEYFTVATAFVWTEADGMRSLQDVATAAGVVVDDGYWLATVLAVSDDGTVVLGRAYTPDFAVETFVMHIPAGAW